MHKHHGSQDHRAEDDTHRYLTVRWCGFTQKDYDYGKSDGWVTGFVCDGFCLL